MPYFYFYTGIHHYKVEYQLINKEKRNMATKTQRKQLKAIFRIVKPLLNPDQRKVLYNNLNEVFNVGVDLGEKRDMSVREVLIESFKPRIGRPTEMFARQPIYNFLIDVIVAINERKHQLEVIVKLQNKETLIYAVGDSLIYTCGVSNTVGYEVVMIGIGSTNLAHEMMALIDAKTEVVVDEPFVLENVLLKGLNVPVRAKYVEVDKENAVRLHMFELDKLKAHLPADYKVYQLLLADSQNRLPGEEGYSFNRQELLPTHAELQPIRELVRVSKLLKDSIAKGLLPNLILLEVPLSKLEEYTKDENLNTITYDDFIVALAKGEQSPLDTHRVLLGIPDDIFAKLGGEYSKINASRRTTTPAPEMLYFICKAVYRYVEGDQWMALRHQSEPFNIIRTTVDIFAPLKPVLHQ